jgi:hypothetical protein
MISDMNNKEVKKKLGEEHADHNVLKEANGGDISSMT